MKIETKFNVNDLVERKYDSYDDTVVLCEIMEIIPVVCIAGAQVFYHTRIIRLQKQINYQNSDKTEKWLVERAITSDGSYPKFREDELVPCSDEHRKIVLGK